MKSDCSSVSEWIASLNAGEMEAVEKLWNRYKDRLIGHARRCLPQISSRAADEEDIAQSVFVSLCRGATAGRFNELQNRDELWWLLVTLTKQKTTDLVRRETAQKRGGGRVQCEAAIGGLGNSEALFSLDNIIGSAPTPEILVIMDEQYRFLLGLLTDTRLRRIAAFRIEGYNVREIAAELSVTTRSVERKLKLIRSAWAEELTRAR